MSLLSYRVEGDRFAIPSLFQENLALMLSVGLTVKNGECQGNTPWFCYPFKLNGVKTIARSRERTRVGGGLIYKYKISF